MGSERSAWGRRDIELVRGELPAPPANGKSTRREGVVRDDASTPSWVWVFHGDGPRRVASAVFSELALAEAWIRRTGASGLLTRYPVDLSVYDWAVAEGHWTPTRDEHRTPDYMQNFNSAYLEHIHYERGARASGG